MRHAAAARSADEACSSLLMQQAPCEGYSCRGLRYHASFKCLTLHDAVYLLTTPPFPLPCCCRHLEGKIAKFATPDDIVFVSEIPHVSGFVVFRIRTERNEGFAPPGIAECATGCCNTATLGRALRYPTPLSNRNDLAACTLQPRMTTTASTWQEGRF